MSQETSTTTEVQRLELELTAARAALEEIATLGRALLQALPIARSVPSALAHGPILTMVGLAESGLPDTQ